VNPRVFSPRKELFFFITSIYYLGRFGFWRLRVPLEKRISMGFCVALESSKSSRNIRVNCCREEGERKTGA
jgi:hypothetical protein